MTISIEKMTMCLQRIAVAEIADLDYFLIAGRSDVINSA